jgi:hypothetical protein
MVLFQASYDIYVNWSIMYILHKFIHNFNQQLYPKLYYYIFLSNVTVE